MQGLSIESEVHSGHFASEEDAIAEAVRLLRHHLGYKGKTPAVAQGPSLVSTPDPVLGAMRDAADELDDIVTDAMKDRELQP